MVKKLYLVRHGETQFNKLDIIQGSCDSKLTAAGREQAVACGRLLKKEGIKFDRIFCSIALRARETLSYITDQEYTYLSQLKEWDFGLFEGEGQCLQRPEVFNNLSPDFYAQFGGESLTDFQKRIDVAIRDILTDTGDNFLVVAHGCVNWAFFEMAVKPDNAPPVKFTNCAVQVYRQEGEQFIYERTLDPLSEL